MSLAVCKNVSLCMLHKSCRNQKTIFYFLSFRIKFHTRAKLRFILNFRQRARSGPRRMCGGGGKLPSRQVLELGVRDRGQHHRVHLQGSKRWRMTKRVQTPSPQLQGQWTQFQLTRARNLWERRLEGNVQLQSLDQNGQFTQLDKATQVRLGNQCVNDMSR